MRNTKEIETRICPECDGHGELHWTVYGYHGGDHSADCPGCGGCGEWLDYCELSGTCPDCGGNGVKEITKDGVLTETDCTRCNGFGTLDGKPADYRTMS